MIDRVAAHISIGGRLCRRDLPNFVSAINDDGAAVDWDGTQFDPGDIPPDAPVALMDHEVAWGRFDRIEQCCRALGLHYVRWSGGYAGAFPSVREVYPGCGEPAAFLTSEDDQLLFPIERIRELASIEAIESEYAHANLDPPPLTIIDDDQAVESTSEAARD